MATLHVRLLGCLQVERGGDVVPIGPPRVRELLACLLLERHGLLPRAHLAYRLWPDSGEGQARTNLRQALHQLRRALPESERLLTLDGPHLGWRADAVIGLDVAVFEQQLAVAVAARQAHDAELERRALGAAAHAYSGELAPEIYAAWIEPHRVRLHEACGQVLERLADLQAWERDDRGAIETATRLVRHDPLAEAPYRLLMQLLERSGERAKALHVYHSCATVLQRELGVEPTATTRALHERLLRLDVALASGQPAPEAPAAPAHAAPLVGRRPDLEALRDAWRLALGGRPRLWLLTGDAGIGKTRLSEEFARGLGRTDGAVAAARCYAAEGALAYAPVTALLRSEAVRPAVVGLAPPWRRELGRLLPELQEEEVPSATDALRRARLFEAVARAFATVQPLLVLLDDLHWCDPDTLAWLHHLLRFDPHGRLLIVATARGHELAAHDALMAWLARLRDEDLLHEAEVGPLNRQETEALAGGLGWRDLSAAQLGRLHADSEGNPLFVIELLRAGAVPSMADRPATTAEVDAALPPRLRAVIRARLAGLSADTAELTGVASVIGREFDLDLLARVSGREEDVAVRGLDELWRRRIVRELSAGQYDFTHDKLREVAYEELSLTRRRLLHRYVAEALEAHHGDDHDEASGRVALHYDRAGLPERAVGPYLRAGDVARRRYAEEEAVAHYQRGLALVADLPATEVLADWRARLTADLLEGLAEVAARRGQHDAAEDGFTRALAARPERDALGRARLSRRIGDTLVARYAYEEGAAAYQVAEHALSEPGAPATTAGDAARAAARERIEIGLARAEMHYWQHRWSEIERDLVAVSDMAAAHAEPRQLGRVYANLARMCFSRDRQNVSDACLEFMRHGHAAVVGTGDPVAIADVGFLLGFFCLWRRELAEAETHLRAALEGAERVGDQPLRARCLTYLAFLQRFQGDVDGVRALVPEGMRVAAELGMPEYVGAAHGQRAWLAWRAGDLAACDLAGRAAVEAWRTGQVYPLQWVARLPLLAACSRTASAADVLAHASVLLDAGQQRLPDELDAALAEFVAAAGGTAPAAAGGGGPATGLRERIERVLGAAARSGLL